ncbi:DUF305 domain-containing protein [Streptomyces lonarensis]|uniref:DUF305 domain-containing protein n=1 Tax=Streptomyces lonarensis TaxID=700599 RepID=A0A7X6I160_9ACTN|nr:DUF305 domain-containing protein [Streptomyces lonarensis]NJQ07979.1 DUF305 domain-containing protein [Streptomyces lonarensis]
MPRHSARTLRTAAATACATAAVMAVLTGCTSGETAEAAATEEDATIIAPAGPGEDARKLTPEQVRAEAADRLEEPNDADVDYIVMMIVHHEQALEMTDLAAEHAHSDPVERLSTRIATAQAPEIEVMRAWLEAYEEEAGPAGHGHDGRHGDHGDHGQSGSPGSGATAGDDHSDMPGMASPEQMAALGDARGATFDQLFLELMIVHHEGAVTMSADVIAEGVDITVNELATEIAAQQAAEVGRMEQMSDDI